jgi:23S rRNA (uracil1939-C5)-methyltransferase
VPAVPTPAAAPATVVARIESLADDARGVARIDGKVTFVDGALPGETVRLRLRKRRRRYDTAALVEVLAPSPERVVAPCPHFGTCGGCSLQHLVPAAQIRAKQDILAQSLSHLARVAPEHWLAPLTGPVWYYRRRARLGVRYLPQKGGALVGFRERRSSYVTPLGDCPVLDGRAARLLPELKTLVESLSCPDRIPQIEVAAADAALALVFRHLTTLTDADRGALRAFAERHAVQVMLQPGGPESIEPLWPQQPAPLAYRLAEYDVTLEFGPADFVQVNAAMNAQVVAQALALLEPGPADAVLDLFCGLGNFTLPLARRAGRVLGIESDAGLVAAARANAARNGLANAGFRTADLYAEAGPAPWAGFELDKLLLDPPRSGAMAAVKRLAAARPARIVYVSCYPSTLARDSAYLVNVLGYRLAAAGVMDMFPHTSHVESMALFLRP